MSELDDALDAIYEEHLEKVADNDPPALIKCHIAIARLMKALDVRGRQVGELLGEIHRSVPDWVQARVEHYDSEALAALKGESDEPA